MRWPGQDATSSRSPPRPKVTSMSSAVFHIFIANRNLMKQIASAAGLPSSKSAPMSSYRRARWNNLLSRNNRVHGWLQSLNSAISALPSAHVEGSIHQVQILFDEWLQAIKAIIQSWRTRHYIHMTTLSKSSEF